MEPRNPEGASQRPVLQCLGVSPSNILRQIQPRAPIRLNLRKIEVEVPLPKKLVILENCTSRGEVRFFRASLRPHSQCPPQQMPKNSGTETQLAVTRGEVEEPQRSGATHGTDLLPPVKKNRRMVVVEVPTERGMVIAVDCNPREKM